MIKFLPNTGLPGFRVGLMEDMPGFGIDQNGSVRRTFASISNAPAYVFDPYGLAYSRPNLPLSRPHPGTSSDVQQADNCPEIIANCKTKCSGFYANGMLPGRGPDAFIALRRCIRDCVAPSGCSY